MPLGPVLDNFFFQLLLHGGGWGLLFFVVLDLGGRFAFFDFVVRLGHFRRHWRFGGLARPFLLTTTAAAATFALLLAFRGFLARNRGFKAFLGVRERLGGKVLVLFIFRDYSGPRIVERGLGQGLGSFDQARAEIFGLLLDLRPRIASRPRRRRTCRFSGRLTGRIGRGRARLGASRPKSSASESQLLSDFFVRHDVPLQAIGACIIEINCRTAESVCRRRHQTLRTVRDWPLKEA